MRFWCESSPWSVLVSQGGSFSFRAKRDGRDWEGAASLRRLQDGEHSGRMTEMEQAAAVGGDVLAVAGAGAENGAELVMPSAQPRRRPECLEAPHTPGPALHAAVVLLEPIGGAAGSLKGTTTIDTVLRALVARG